MRPTRAAVERLVDPARAILLDLDRPSYGLIYAARRGSARLGSMTKKADNEDGRKRSAGIVRRPGPPIRLFPLTATAVAATMVVLFCYGFAADLPVTRSAMRQLFYAPQCTLYRRRHRWHVSTVRSRTFYIRSLRASLSCRIHWTSSCSRNVFSRDIFAEESRVRLFVTRKWPLTAIKI